MTTVELRELRSEEVVSSSSRGPSSQREDPLQVAYRADGQLWAMRGGAAWPVSVRRCFPWTEGARFVSLRDGDESEVALVTDPAELDEPSRQALERALLEAGFVFRVTRVLEIEEEVEIRTWRVETREGTRAFQTRLDDWPQDVPGGGLLIRDVAGDLYGVWHPETMDKKSRELLWAFVD